MEHACSSAMHMHLLHTMAEARVVKKRSFDAAESLSTQEEQVSWMKQLYYQLQKFGITVCKHTVGLVYCIVILP